MVPAPSRPVRTKTQPAPTRRHLKRKTAVGGTDDRLVCLYGVWSALVALCRQDRALQRRELAQIGLGLGAGFLVLGVGHVLARILDAASQPFAVDIVDMGR